jgi:hypothetical protein
MICINTKQSHALNTVNVAAVKITVYRKDNSSGFIHSYNSESQKF